MRWQDGSLPGPQWQQAVAEAVAAIKAGRLRKVVLAQDLFATATETIDVRAVARLAWPAGTPTASPSPATAWWAPLRNC